MFLFEALRGLTQGRPPGDPVALGATERQLAAHLPKLHELVELGRQFLDIGEGLDRGGVGQRRGRVRRGHRQRGVAMLTERGQRGGHHLARLAQRGLALGDVRADAQYLGLDLDRPRGGGSDE